MKQIVIKTLLMAFVITGVSMTAAPTVFADCAKAPTAIIKCPGVSGSNGGGIWFLLETVINILAVGVGIVAVGGVLYGAFLYTTAGDRADQVTKAVHMMVNVGIGLVVYFLFYAFLQYLIPGGVFS